MHVSRGDLAGQDRIFTLGLEGAAVARLAANQVGVAAQVHVQPEGAGLGADHRSELIRQIQVPGGGAGDGGRQRRGGPRAVGHAQAAVGEVEIRNAQRRNAGDIAARAIAIRRAGNGGDRAEGAGHQLQFLSLCHLAEHVGSLLRRDLVRRGRRRQPESAGGESERSARGVSDGEHRQHRRARWYAGWIGEVQLVVDVTRRGAAVSHRGGDAANRQLATGRAAYHRKVVQVCGSVAHAILLGEILRAQSIGPKLICVAGLNQALRGGATFLGGSRHPGHAGGEIVEEHGWRRCVRHRNCFHVALRAAACHLHSHRGAGQGFPRNLEIDLPRADIVERRIHAVDTDADARHRSDKVIVDIKQLGGLVRVIGQVRAIQRGQAAGRDVSQGRRGIQYPRGVDDRRGGRDGGRLIDADVIHQHVLIRKRRVGIGSTEERGGSADGEVQQDEERRVEFPRLSGRKRRWCGRVVVLPVHVKRDRILRPLDGVHVVVVVDGLAQRQRVPAAGAVVAVIARANRRCRSVRGAVVGRRVVDVAVSPEVLHDVDFATPGPADGCDVFTEHPERRPYAEAGGWKLDSGFDQAVCPAQIGGALGSAGAGLQARGCVIAAGIADGADHQVAVAVLKCVVGGAGVVFEFAVSPAIRVAVAGIVVPVVGIRRGARRPVELIAPHELPAGSGGLGRRRKRGK